MGVGGGHWVRENGRRGWVGVRGPGIGVEWVKRDGKEGIGVGGFRERSEVGNTFATHIEFLLVKFSVDVVFRESPLYLL